MRTSHSGPYACHLGQSGARLALPSLDLVLLHVQGPNMEKKKKKKRQFILPVLSSCSADVIQLQIALKF